MKIILDSCMILSVLVLLNLGIVGSLSADQATYCSKGMTLCNGTHCTDLKSDESACGSCGNICTIGTSCINGTCKCLEGETLCGGRCVDTSFDFNNCGKCGNSCPAGQFCINGGCTCANGNLFCNGTCIDKDIDDNNCGECGNVCPPGTGCSGGACYPYYSNQYQQGQAPYQSSLPASVPDRHISVTFSKGATVSS
jgi:hypothetical protein